MIELIIVLPTLIFTLLALVQLADILVASMATQWAARLAARSAAVHVTDKADEFAKKTVSRVLAPFLPPVPNVDDATAGLPLTFRWIIRSAAYDTSAGATLASLGGGSPLGVTLRVVFAGGEQSLANAVKLLGEGERASARVNVDFSFPLRVPIVNRFFASRNDGAPVRQISAVGQFPVMYAPTKK